MKEDLEPYLRMAISNIKNSIALTERLPEDNGAYWGWALGAMDNAVESLHAYARGMGIEIRDSMKT